MRKLFIPFIVSVVLIAFTGCTAYKQVPYWQNIDTTDLSQSKGLYDARIMPKDLLTITVSTSDPKAAQPFNLSISNTSGTTGAMSSGHNLLQYLVDNSGNIDFPVIGKIHVQGLTKGECQDLIRERVKPYLAATENPIVTGRMSSLRVTVIGEVGGSRVIPVTTEKMSIVEALASAGDLGIHGKRQNILLIREDANGEKHHVRLDMTDANLFNSPYYYLQQNDIIYVEPSVVKTKGADLGASTSLWFSFIGIVTSVASLLVSVLRN